MYVCRTISRDFKWLPFKENSFTSFAYFAGEWVQVGTHATILEAELHLVCCTKAVCLECKFPTRSDIKDLPNKLYTDIPDPNKPESLLPLAIGFPLSFSIQLSLVP